MYLVYQFDINEDPELLSQTLWRLKILHRVINSKGRNELWVTDQVHQDVVKQLVQVWKDDPDSLLNLSPSLTSSSGRQSSNLMMQIKAAPATIVVLAAAFFIALISQLGSDLSIVAYFTISPIQVFGTQIRFFSLANVLSQGEYWRLATPALLHFSVMHIVFNALWVWEIGKKLERLLGSIIWSVGVLIIAIVSNVLQYQMSGNPLFGGLSGVVYGLIGFAWLTPIIVKAWPLIISKQLMIFFVVWLAIGYTPFPEMVGLGSIANTAHTIGLVAGLVLSGVYWLVTRHRYS
ncbi:rhomboid family intramembrane serine protease [Marinomonas transparens]|uniref:Rhomboid family intramembrane serine protease n=1 Tax=Marinomonas transparens TaxID=2795388 RepID=A0A934N1W8_9GAMM|nr:rhomboid family intramembrane serine protease [Marinomonas transparens]MBJ7538162.1 rhomboid family intramembrane serine protease [Marinomonas transparens]